MTDPTPPATAAVPYRSLRAEAAAATRDKVVATARKLFDKHGFTLITMRQVAAAADMSTGSIFAHFDGKDSLFKAAFPTDHRRRRMAEAMCDAFHAANIWPTASSALRDRWLAATDSVLERPSIAQSTTAKAA